MRVSTIWTVLLASAFAATPAQAQRVPFEKTFEATGIVRLDASTIRGKIEIVSGGADRIVVGGAVTVRVGLDVPLNAEQIAQALAGNPPIERDGNTILLRPPSSATERRAVTINYQVRVPPNTEVLAVSDSGAIRVERVTGRVEVRTQSGAIELRQLGDSSATSGSGAVVIDGTTGSLSVTTSSSAFTGRAVGGNLRVRTMSGAVDASLSGAGDVDVETGSSAIRLDRVRGAIAARTRSGSIKVQGAPERPWDMLTGSSSVDVAVATSALNLDARSRSGSVQVQGANINGTIDKRAIKGTAGAGGPLVRITTGSGAIRVRVLQAPSSKIQDPSSKLGAAFWILDLGTWNLEL